MKIVQATNYLPGYHRIWGGAEQACYRILKLLNREGQEVSVFSLTPSKELKEDFNFFSIKILEDYIFTPLKKYIKKIKITFFPFDPISFISSYKILRKIRPDVLHLHNFKVLSFSLLQSARLLKIPTVATIYDYWSLCPEGMLINREGEVCHKFHGKQCIGCCPFKRFKHLQNLFLFFRKRIFDFFLNKIDAFIVLSDASAQLLQSYGIKEKKIHVIPQAFSFSDTANEEIISIEKFSILYAGWVEHRKGLHIIIEALPHILKKVPKAKLYVVGKFVDKEYKKKLDSLMKRYHLSKDVFFLGKKNYSEVKRFLKKANVVVVPEQWENMSPVILVEAMAHSRPVVASAIGGIPEFVKNGENGFLANPKDSTNWAKKIIWIFKNEREAIKMGKQARKDVMKICDEKRILRKTLNLYRTLVKKYG